MSWSKKRLKNANLYLILDRQVLSYRDLLKALKPAVRGGVDLVQLRDKNGSAKDILDFCRQARKITAGKALFIVNDRVDLALLADADGVHLGQEDIPYAQARGLMGPQAIIGVSCQRLEQVKEAQRQGADYIGFGSVFKTQTKPERKCMNLELLNRVLEMTKIPVFSIGGISRSNLSQLTAQGVRRVAICRDILLAQNIKETVASLKNMLRG
ncbi:MAG: thiamine phosphate synthase [Candidatus Omnitrophica bacterium]|nr:thiamine phosphate synthase [Candidatus Omnitrophota bacterium]